MAWPTIDPTTPLGTDKIKFGDDAIRTTKQHIVDGLGSISNYNSGGSTPAILTTVWDTDGRPSGASLVDGVTGLNSTLGRTEYYDLTNTKWVDNAPALPGLVNDKINVTSNTAATITADYAILTNGSGSFAFLSGISESISTATLGAGGRDTGSLAASTWYYVWLLCGVSGTCCVMSTSYSAPTLSSGYTHYVYVGPLRTNSDSYLYRTKTRCRKTQYVVDGTILTFYPVAFTGTGTSSVDISSYVPSTAIIVKVRVTANGGSPGSIAVGPSSNSTPNGQFGLFTAISPGTGANYSSTGDIIIETANTLYVSSTGSSSNTFYIVGWEE